MEADGAPTQWLEDVSAAEWIESRLHPAGQDTGSIIPEGFEAYARLLHPADPQRGDGQRWRWSEIAAQNGRTIHSETLFEEITPTTKTLNDGWGTPELGTLPLPERATLIDLLRPSTKSPDDCWFCVWDGFGQLDPQGVSARVRLPWREYLLRRGPIETVMDPIPTLAPVEQLVEGPWVPAPVEWWRDQSPNLWWPADRAWIVATDIDHDYTYVGGTAELIARIVNHPKLEAMPASLSDFRD